ncbi:MAG: universal stress protein [Sciscionella sp.]|nr:universal stress protein [Sciscionella sp.]
MAKVPVERDPRHCRRPPAPCDRDVEERQPKQPRTVGGIVNAQQASKPIVVGVDGSPYSTPALRWAVNEAARRGCAVRALMVWHANAMLAAGRPTTLGIATQLPGEPSSDYEKLLAETVSEAIGERTDVPIDAEVVRGGPPESLTKASEDAQLLVLGSHGRGRLAESILGSVAQYCVKHAGCPVLIIPARLADCDTEHHTPTAPGGYQPGPLL